MPLLVVVGYGPGNGHAIAQRFGREGWTIALIGRNESRLRAGVAQLAADGVVARAFVGDASDPHDLRATFDLIRSESGTISSIALTAFRSIVVTDVLTADPTDVAHVFDIGVSGMLAAVQASLPDLTASDHASVLVVNGALGQHDDGIDAFAASVGGDGVALECAAKSKLVGLLAARLRDEGVYVGELVINGSVKGTPHAGPNAIDPADVAERLWTMSLDRTHAHALIAEASR